MSIFDSVLKNGELAEEIISDYQKLFSIFLQDLNESYEELKTENAKETAVKLLHSLHPLYTTSRYIKLDPVAKVSSILESVLQNVSDKDEPMTRNVYMWTQQAMRIYNIWQDEINQEAEELTPPPEKLISLINITHDQLNREDMKKLKVLFVDDEESIRNQMNRFLNIIFKEVFIAENGKDGFELFAKNKPDIVITDINMPRVNGFQLAKLIRKVSPLTPIFFLTAYSLNQFIFKSNLLGVNSYLVKPVNFEVMLKRIGEALGAYIGIKNVKVTDNSINGFLSEVPPVPDVIKELIDACDDVESSIKDITVIVKKDTQLVEAIEKHARNTFFSQKHLHNVDKAVAMFGKTNVRAISSFMIFSNVKHNSRFDIAPYGLSYKQYIASAEKRMRFIELWYREVDKKMLNILHTTALLGSIGQSCIAGVIKDMGKTYEFKQMIKEAGVYNAELEFTKTTTPEVSARILEKWKFAPVIIESVRHSLDPYSAPEGRFKYALANSILFTLVDIVNHNRNIEIDNYIVTLFNEENLDIRLLYKAVQTLEEREELEW